MIRRTTQARRRHVLVALAGQLSALGVARAQQPGRAYRLGWVSTTRPDAELYNRAFVERLAAQGFAVGRNLSIEYRRPEAAAELSALRCDALFAPGSEFNLRAAKLIAGELPIVVVCNDYDPVATGHVASLARPGGRITGVSQLQSELPAKRLEVLRELLPRIRRVGVLADASTTGQLAASRAAAARLGLELVVHEFAATPYDYAAAFDHLVRGRAEALLALTSGLFVTGRRPIVELTQRHKLPSLFNNYLWAEAGGLVSYGPNFVDTYSRAAEMLARVMNGARPSDMPIEQASAVEMVLNAGVARAMGVTVPGSILARADRIVD
jgi:putative ABC transport system substrate-binding protein